MVITLDSNKPLEDPQKTSKEENSINQDFNEDKAGF